MLNYFIILDNFLDNLRAANLIRSDSRTVATCVRKLRICRQNLLRFEQDVYLRAIWRQAGSRKRVRVANLTWFLPSFSDSMIAIKLRFIFDNSLSISLDISNSVYNLFVFAIKIFWRVLFKICSVGFIIWVILLYHFLYDIFFTQILFIFTQIKMKNDYLEKLKPKREVTQFWTKY